MRSVFTYGTLMDLCFVERMLGHPVKALPATLNHYVKLEPSFYMIFPHWEGSVEGLLIHGLSNDDVARFDRYEGNGYGYYDRQSVWVTTKGAPYPVKTEAYVGGDHMSWFYKNWLEAQRQDN